MTSKRVKDIVMHLKSFYNLNRTELHLITGISCDALKRYELNGDTPNDVQLNLLLMILDIRVFQRLCIFRVSKGIIKNKTFLKVNDKVRQEYSNRIASLIDSDGDIFNTYDVNRI